MKTLLAVLALTVAACSSSTATPSGPVCSDVSGNWKVTSTRTDGDCTAPQFNSGEANITMRKGTDGAWSVVLPGLSGGCPGELDAKTCRFVANCDITSGTTKTASVGVEWNFDGKTISGSEIGRILSPSACTANYTDSGAKL